MQSIEQDVEENIRVLLLTLPCFLGRRGVYAAVLLAFPALILLTISRRPSYAGPENQESDVDNLPTRAPQIALAPSEGSELPHNPLSKEKSQSSFQQAADAVADLVVSEPFYHLKDFEGFSE